MIYGYVKNRKIKKAVKHAISPTKTYITENLFNDTTVRNTAWAMMKYYKSIGWYKRRYVYD